MRLSILTQIFCFHWLVSTLKLSKNDECLQSNKLSLTGLPLGLTLFLVNSETPQFLY